MGINFPKNIFIIYIGIVSTLLLAWDVYLQITPDKSGLYNYLYNLGYAVLYISAAGIALYGNILLYKTTKISKALFYLGLGCLSYGIALIIWAYYNLALKVTIPYPSLADAFFILFYPLMAVGILITLNTLSVVITQKKVIETIVIAILAIFAVFLINPPQISSNISLVTRVFNLAYPLADVLLISLIYLGSRVSSGKLNLGLIILSIGLIFQTIGDFVFTLRDSNNIYWNGDIADLLFTASALMLALGFVYIITDLTSLSRKT